MGENKMPEDGKTFGDFFDEVEELSEDSSNTKTCVGEWICRMPAGSWKKANAMPLTTELVEAFAEGIASTFFKKINDANTPVLYKALLEEGHAFLQRVYRIATKFGLEIDMKRVDMPLTQLEALSRSFSVFL